MAVLIYDVKVQEVPDADFHEIINHTGSVADIDVRALCLGPTAAKYADVIETIRRERIPAWRQSRYVKDYTVEQLSDPFFDIEYEDTCLFIAEEVRRELRVLPELWDETLHNRDMEIKRVRKDRDSYSLRLTQFNTSPWWKRVWWIMKGGLV